MYLWIVCIVISANWFYVFGKVSFVKDQKMDAVFPPIVAKIDAGIPEGHLRPLGWQKRPDGMVPEEKKSMITPKKFHATFVKNKKPIKFRDALKDSAVLQKWEKDEYLKEKYGALNVSVVVKKERLRSDGRIMKFYKFLLDYMYEDWYMSNTIPQEMMEELPLAQCLECGTFRDSLYEAELWMSSGGTASLLHSHEQHNLHCVLFGRKDFILIDSKHKANFEFEDKYPSAGAGHSPIDMDMINVFKHTKIGQTPWRWSTLKQGDCIFVPAGYLHQVRSYGRSISYTILFTPFSKFQEKSRDCDKPLVKPLSLAKANFVWMYFNGHRQLTNEKLEAESTRQLILALTGDNDKLYQDQFVHFYNEVMHPIKATMQFDEMFAEKAFEIMDWPNPKGYVTRDQIKNLTNKQLDAIANQFNQVHVRLPKHDEL